MSQPDRETVQQSTVAAAAAMDVDGAAGPQHAGGDTADPAETHDGDEELEGDNQVAETVHIGEEEEGQSQPPAGETAEGETEEVDVSSAMANEDEEAAATAASTEETEATEAGADHDGATDDVAADVQEVEEETVEMDEAEVQQLLRDRITAIMANPTEELSIASILQKLKNELGKEAVRQHKDFIRDFVKQEARRLQEAQDEAEEEQQAEGEEGADVDAEAAEDDGEYEEQRRKRNKAKRLRRKAEEDDGEDGAAGDEDYEERKSSKRRIPLKAGRKLKDKGGAAGKRIGPLPPRSAYLLFSALTRPQLRQDNPDATFAELSKMIGELWKGLDKQEHKQWKQQSEEDKERYRQEMEQLRDTDPIKYEEAVREAKAKSKRKGGRESDGDDDRPKRKKKRASDSGSGGDDGEPDAAKELSWFDKMLNGMKNRRQTKSAYDEDDTKEMCKRFLARMDNAARQDEDCMSREQPAVSKLKMLEEVQAQVGKKEVADRLIDHGLLKVVNKWLLPNPDGSLPNIRLRTTMYKMLDQLPVTETDLETSGGLGRTVMQLWQHEDETPDNKKLLGLMIEKWMRPLLGLKTQYKHLADFEEEQSLAIQRRSAQLTQRRLPDINTGRARIPEPANFDYAIRPQSLVERDMDDEEEERKERNKDDEGRRVKMIRRLDKMNKGAAAAGGRAKYKVDISGRLRT